MAQGGNVSGELIEIIRAQWDKNAEQKVSRQATALKGNLKKILGAVGVTVSIAAVAKFTRDALAVAAQVEQMRTKFNDSFGEMSSEAENWARSVGEATGRARSDVRNYMLSIKDAARQRGASDEGSSKLALDASATALDLAAYNNMGDAEAVNAMTKALNGEANAMRALGVQYDENTRKQAMNTLGINQAYEALDAETQMAINYQVILEQQTKAIGAASRALDTLNGKQMRNQSLMRNVKENVGNFLLPYAKVWLDFQGRIIKKLEVFTGKLGSAEEKGTLANKALIAFTKGLELLEKGIDFVIRGIRGFINMVGGTENAIQVITVALGALLALRFVDKIGGWAGAIKTLSGLFSGLNLQVLAVVAAIVGLFIIIEDFVSFMNGKDSLFGRMLDANGIDQDEVREKVFGIGEKVSEVVDGIRKKLAEIAASEEFQSFMESMRQLGEIIGVLFVGHINGMVSAFGPFLDTLSSAAEVIGDILNILLDILSLDFTSFIEDILKFGEDLYKTIENWVLTILSYLEKIGEAIDAITGGAFSEAIDSAKEFLGEGRESTSGREGKVDFKGNKADFRGVTKRDIAEATTEGMVKATGKGTIGSGNRDGAVSYKPVAPGGSGTRKGSSGSTHGGSSGTFGGAVSALSGGGKVTPQTVNQTIEGDTTNKTYNVSVSAPVNQTFNSTDTGNMASAAGFNRGFGSRLTKQIETAIAKAANG